MDPGPVYLDDYDVWRAKDAADAAKAVFEEARVAGEAAWDAVRLANENRNEASKAVGAAAAAHSAAMMRRHDAREAVSRAVKIAMAARSTAHQRAWAEAAKKQLNDAEVQEKATKEAYDTASATAVAAHAERNRLHSAAVAADERSNQAYISYTDADSIYRRVVRQRDRQITSRNIVEDPTLEPQPEGNGNNPRGGRRNSRRKTRRNRRNKRRTNKNRK